MREVESALPYNVRFTALPSKKNSSPLPSTYSPPPYGIKKEP